MEDQTWFPLDAMSESNYLHPSGFQVKRAPVVLKLSAVDVIDLCQIENTHLQNAFKNIYLFRKSRGVVTKTEFLVGLKRFKNLL